MRRLLLLVTLLYSIHLAIRKWRGAKTQKIFMFSTIETNTLYKDRSCNISPAEVLVLKGRKFPLMILFSNFCCLSIYMHTYIHTYVYIFVWGVSAVDDIVFPWKWVSWARLLSANCAIFVISLLFLAGFRCRFCCNHWWRHLANCIREKDFSFVFLGHGQTFTSWSKISQSCKCTVLCAPSLLIAINSLMNFHRNLRNRKNHFQNLTDVQSGGNWGSGQKQLAAQRERPTREKGQMLNSISTRHRKRTAVGLRFHWPVKGLT